MSFSQTQLVCMFIEIGYDSAIKRRTQTPQQKTKPSLRRTIESPKDNSPIRPFAFSPPPNMNEPMTPSMT